jgi:hypothetical protein
MIPIKFDIEAKATFVAFAVGFSTYLSPPNLSGAVTFKV